MTTHREPVRLEIWRRQERELRYLAMRKEQRSRPIETDKIVRMLGKKKRFKPHKG